MEFLKLCCVSPHPPIIVREIGGPEVKRIKKSVEALEELAAEIAALHPETLIVMSPHTSIYGDAFIVMTGGSLSGSFSQFGSPHVRIQSTSDDELADALAEIVDSKGIPLVKGHGESSSGGVLDHGILVPLYYLAPGSYQLLCLSISLLTYGDHYRLGTSIREAVEKVGRKAIFIGSGDLSHRLIPGAPAGYSPSGDEFDGQIVKIMNSGDYGKLFELDPKLVDDAGECGLRSIITLAGTVDGYSVDSRVLSYEGPFGVGYMVARVAPGEADRKRHLSPE